ncbi:MAG: Ig-like domain-containing protein, partial [Paramuribaculum sp.]|nr:Ig-like domain-containing protein [Paramuribaculum sp.]
SSSKEAYASANVWNTFKEIRGIEFYLDINDATLKPGKTLDLRNNIVNTVGVEVKSLTWNSSDSDVATVDSEGVVTAVADGKATITVNAVDENDQTYTDECEITVDSTSGINVITTDSKGVIDYSAAYDVFTINGVLVGKSVESLAPGLYIVRQKAASAKILVK